MSSGIVKGVDRMGRVTIPKEIRTQLKIENDVDSFEIYLEGDKVILEKYRPACIFCNSIIENVFYEGYCVCKSCIHKLYEIKDITE